MKAEKARLDKDGTAKPKTRLVAHVNRDHCVGPHTSADTIEDTTTGERTPLKAEADMITKKLWLHVTSSYGETKSFASLKGGSEARDYFGNYGPHIPTGLPSVFSTLYVRYGSKDGETVEVWFWGDSADGWLVDSTELGEGSGLIVSVDGKDVYDSWKETEGE